jgi:hypothetical protein
MVGSPTKEIRQEKGKKKHPKQRRRYKTISTDDMILYIKTLWTVQILLDLINKFSKDAGYKRSVIFVPTSNELSERKLRK